MSLEEFPKAQKKNKKQKKQKKQEELDLGERIEII